MPSEKSTFLLMIRCSIQVLKIGPVEACPDSEEGEDAKAEVDPSRPDVKVNIFFIWSGFRNRFEADRI